MPSIRLKSPTMGMDPPPPMMAAFVPHSSDRASAAFVSCGMSQSSCVAGPRPWAWNSARQSAGRPASTCLRNAAATLAGSCVPTRRKETLAEALAGMTVLKPSPV